MMYPLPTRDPVTGDELIVTRLECPSTGTAIEGRFTLGWIGRLTPSQLDLVGLLLRNRNNLQKVADTLGVAYNTARARLDEIVDAVGGADAPPTQPDRMAILDRLASGDLTYQEALAKLRGDEG